MIIFSASAWCKLSLINGYQNTSECSQTFSVHKWTLHEVLDFLLSCGSSEWKLIIGCSYTWDRSYDPMKCSKMMHRPFAKKRTTLFGHTWIFAFAYSWTRKSQSFCCDDDASFVFILLRLLATAFICFYFLNSSIYSLLNPRQYILHFLFKSFLFLRSNSKVMLNSCIIFSLENCYKKCFP